MKRFVFVFFGVLILHCAVFADIADTISKYTSKNPLIVYDFDYQFYCHKSYRKIKYFHVELKDVQGKIMCEIMYEPSLNSGIYTALRTGGENIPAIKIIGIGNRREQIHDMYDFWYLLEYENKQLWVFGYYIYFWEGIWLKNRSDK